MYRLAKVQEDHGLVDSAEDTLLQTRRQQPDAVEPYALLSAFYGRQAAARRRVPERNDGGPYRVGGDLRPPSKVMDVKPVYPPEALAQRVQGVVILEVVVNEFGRVTQPKVLRSIPLLDEAALEAVRQWQFTPSMLNGQTVPVVMTTTVNFTLPASDAAASPPRP
jgi:protein TonB